MTHAGVALVNPQFIFDKAGIQKGMHVADFGCGRTGHFVFSLSRLVDDVGSVYAVDVLKDVLLEIKSRCRSGGFNNVQTIWSDIELSGKTAIPEGALDAVFFVNVLSLLKNRLAALKEACRIVRLGGKVVVVEWSKSFGPLGPKSDELIPMPALLELCESAGLVCLDQEAAGEYHYFFVGKKIV